LNATPTYDLVISASLCDLTYSNIFFFKKLLTAVTNH
jgi:hypothetical protein